MSFLNSKYSVISCSSPFKVLLERLPVFSMITQYLGSLLFLTPSMSAMRILDITYFVNFRLCSRKVAYQHLRNSRFSSLVGRMTESVDHLKNTPQYF